MYKIIRIEEESVYIGTEDGRFFCLNKSELNFEPHKGDTVDVYKNGSKLLVLLKEAAPHPQLEETQTKNSTSTVDNSQIITNATPLDISEFKERKSIVPTVVISIITAIIIACAAVYFHDKHTTTKAAEYANALLKDYKKKQDSFFVKNNRAGSIYEIGLTVQDVDYFKVEYSSGLFKITSQRDMAGCPAGTIWSISNDVEKNYWRESTPTSYIHHYDYKIHYKCNMNVTVEKQELLEEAKQSCEWFLVDFKAICN